MSWFDFIPMGDAETLHHVIDGIKLGIDRETIMKHYRKELGFSAHGCRSIYEKARNEIIYEYVINHVQKNMKTLIDEGMISGLSREWEVK